MTRQRPRRLGAVLAGLALAAACRNEPAGYRLVATWQPRGEGRLEEPQGIAVGPDGAVLVADARRGAVLVYGADGSFRRALGEDALDRPVGVAVCEEGSVVVADFDADAVVVFDRDGALRGTIGGLDAPTGVACAGGAAYVVEFYGHRVRRLSLEGGIVATWGGPERFHYPVGVTVAPDGTVWVADTHHYRLCHLDADGRLLACVGEQGSSPGTFEDPAAVALDEAGRLHVGDSGHRRIQMLSPAGAPLAVWDLPAPRDTERGYFAPTGLAWGPDGRLYATDVGRAAVYVLVPSPP